MDKEYSQPSKDVASADQGNGEINPDQLVAELFGDDDENEEEVLNEKQDQEEILSEDDNSSNNDKDSSQQQSEEEGGGGEMKEEDEEEDSQQNTNQAELLQDDIDEQVEEKQVVKKKEEEDDDAEDEIVLKTIVKKDKQASTKTKENEDSRKKEKRSRSSHKKNKESKQPNQLKEFSHVLNQSNRRHTSKRSRSRTTSAYKDNSNFCCSKCKKNDKGGRTCICLVPSKDRRISIDITGCQTCGCKGCSKGKQEWSMFAPATHQPSSSKRTKENRKSRSPSLFEVKNGCCKQCLKAFSKTGKACLCQVPEKVRKSTLGKNGCKYCGCKGCNPEDKKEENYRNGIRNHNRSTYSREKERRPIPSQSKDSNKNRSYSRERAEISTRQMNAPSNDFPPNLSREIDNYSLLF